MASAPPSPDYHAMLVDLMQAISASLAELEKQLCAEGRAELELVRNGEGNDG